MSQTPSLKALSVLLCYPSADLIAALPEICAVLANVSVIEPLLAHFQQGSLIELQENYVALFDRGRALSLHLFEHLHGESRDRGQAMVDLMSMYQSHGFDMSAQELPDYIPLFLEFLAQLPNAEAVELLGNTAAILQLLAERLEARDSQYHCLFDALLILSGKARINQGLVKKATAESDETILNMDEIWEEETVTFMANKNVCGASNNTEQPIAFTAKRTEPNLSGL